MMLLSSKFVLHSSSLLWRLGLRSYTIHSDQIEHTVQLQFLGKTSTENHKQLAAGNSASLLKATFSGAQHPGRDMLLFTVYILIHQRTVATQWRI